MTAASLRRSWAIHRLWWMIAGVALFLVAAGGLFQWRSASALAATGESALIAPTKAAALIRATSGHALNEVKAVGEDARLINATMPFDKGPLRAARPFDIAGDSDVDNRRALLCLTQAVYYEAGFEPLAGRRAVAQVVLNRMRHPAFPKSVCGVVYQGSRSPVCQFSFVCDGALYRRPSAEAWREAHDIAAAALSGYVEASVGSATHYHADYVTPRWAPMLSKVAQLGAHIFYRWPGAWGMPAAFTGRYIGEPYDPASLRPPLRPAVLPGLESGADGLPMDIAGPPVARAPNDVGGLLDTSKGWTLTIPLPSESAAATQSIASKQGGNTQAAASAPVTAPVLASR